MVVPVVLPLIGVTMMISMIASGEIIPAIQDRTVLAGLPMPEARAAVAGGR